MERPIKIGEILQSLSMQEQNEILQPGFKTPLEYYLQGYNVNPNTTDTVREEAITKIRTMARKRVAVRNAIKKNPDILKTRDDPLIIIGLHRSGTTMLNRLLASDPQFIAPMLWEMMQPLPPGRPQDWRKCQRYKAAKKEFECHTYNVDGSKVDAVHVYELELQEECMLILMDHFMELPEIQYVKTMEKLRDFVYNPPKEHLKKAYEYYRQCLQCISYQSDKRILVKSGMHVMFMDALKEAFPNGKFVLILRNPKEIIPSLSSLASKHAAEKNFHDDELGKRMVQYFGLASERAVDFVQNTSKESVFTISYTDLVKDPMSAVKDLYSHFNFNLAPDAEEAMKCHMVDNKQNKHGKHSYGIEDFGITVDDIKTSMKTFLEYYKDQPDLAV